MSEGADNRNGLERVDANSNVWSVISELATLNQHRQFRDCLFFDRPPDLEACLHRVLRPHDEAGFVSPDDDWMIDLRARLDRALDFLTYLEIRSQLGLASRHCPSGAAPEHLYRLFGSEAFLRYVNAYLYFGVRFFADGAPADPFTSEEFAADCDINVRPFPLKYPPELSSGGDAEALLARFTNLPRGALIQEAFNFLDDIREVSEPTLYESQEPTEYELWCRGLHPDLDDAKEQHFERITAGLVEWVISRSEFYLSLRPPHSLPIEPRESGKGPQRRPAQGWLVTHPMAARIALADMYWIARILRADVSANASVTYQKQSWLHLIRFHTILERDCKRSTGTEAPPEPRSPGTAADGVPPAKAVEPEAIEKAEEAIRSVFDYVCDLIQNSVELTRERNARPEKTEKTASPPSQAEKWRAVFDEELNEIDRQRRVRHFRDPSLPPEAPGSSATVNTSTVRREPEAASKKKAQASEQYLQGQGIEQDSLKAAGRAPAAESPGEAMGGGWSKRIRTGERPLNLIGLAFSGGGIRSATFNLGILQGLQELDLLRSVDYLSTVSGGGFIGSWLVANVRRSSQWLGRLTDWSDSIAHLRAHSNYLAPRTGILSADTYNLANSWVRNAFLIQLTGIAWLFVLLLTFIAGLHVFLGLDEFSLPIYGNPTLGTFVSSVMALIVTVVVLYNLEGTTRDGTWKTRQSGWVRWLAVTPGWIGAFALSAHFWRNAPKTSTYWSELQGLTSYSSLLFHAYRSWGLLLGTSAAALFCIAWRTIGPHRPLRRLNAIWISPLCVFALYLELVGIFFLFRLWSTSGDQPHKALAFNVGPVLIAAAFSVCVLLFIGFTGRHSSEALREWWTRFGTWLAIYAVIGFFFSGAAVFGPWIIHKFIYWNVGHTKTLKAIQWTSVLSWLGTVIAGIFAGKSSKTKGEGGTPSLEVLAKVGSLLFIVGGFLLGSTLLYILLLNIFGSESFANARPLTILVDLCLWKIGAALGLCVVLGLLFSWSFEINIFSLNQFYRNRIVRCYLGATRWTPGLRKPNPFTKFDFKDDLKLSRFRTDDPDPCSSEAEIRSNLYRGPFPLINCTLNLAGSSDLSLNTRHSASFTLTPLRCGSDRPRVGYAPTWSTNGAFADGVPLGQGVAISGAAVSSNMGYNTSPLVAFLLTMFNVRLGWWFPNPSRKRWNARGLKSSLAYLLLELLGIADEKRLYLNVSDGGHFENLAVYELVRRRCKLIIACDAECDEQLQFGGLGNLIRICETDFGAVVEIDVRSIRPHKEDFSLAHCAVGTIKYSNGEIGRLIYLKASMTGDEDPSIAQYRATHPSFPHETTANQFFSEDQFESYRKLGLHVVRQTFKGNLPGDDPLLTAERLADVLTPAGCSSEAFLKHSAALKLLWEKFRQSPSLLSFLKELTTLGLWPDAASVSDEELCIGLELIQLMEDAFLDLRLDDFWDHPDNRGWAILFMRWSRSPRFRLVWERTRRTFGIRFEYFCNARLGLKRDQPMVRV